MSGLYCPQWSRTGVTILTRNYWFLGFQSVITKLCIEFLAFGVLNVIESLMMKMNFNLEKDSSLKVNRFIIP